jgi:ABC-type uncharacterized transport system auxiliary subunit
MMLTLLCASCALTNKSDSVFFRYYTLDRVAAPTAAAAPSTVHTEKLRLRLGRVSAAAYLKDKIAYRDVGNEIGFYEQLRWTERPDAYLARAMSRALFEDHAIQQIVGGAGPTLEIELNVFEELRAPRHAARVEVSWMLRDDSNVIVQKTLNVERPIVAAKSDVEATAVATAMAGALGDAIEVVITAVLAELGR